MVQPIHTAVRGRARYKVKGLYHSESLKQNIEKGLVNEARVISFSVNILTGNVLVFFPPEESSSVIASLLKSILDSYIKKLQESGPPARTVTSPAKEKAPLREKFKRIAAVMKNRTRRTGILSVPKTPSISHALRRATA